MWEDINKHHVQLQQRAIPPCRDAVWNVVERRSTTNQRILRILQLVGNAVYSRAVAQQSGRLCAICLVRLGMEECNKYVIWIFRTMTLDIDSALALAKRCW